jgi:signal transduction histidine kinase
MYAEMLTEGWAGEDKKRSYYHYIFDESERLSRLIANVLQLARMTRNEFAVDTQPVTVAALMDGIASKVSSQVERAGFELQLTQDSELENVSVQVDEDAFSQIVINLVDNALKFSSSCDVKRIEIHCRAGDGSGVEFTVRDHGPGVPRDQMKKIFRLFYRSQSELTRETVGTGIGLALVNELARAMGARVDVSNVEPGALFTLWVARATPGRTAATG